MSLRITTDIFCDGPACAAWTDGITQMRINARVARKQAARAGWIYAWWPTRGYVDLCPQCVPMLQQAKAETEQQAQRAAAAGEAGWPT